MGLAEREFKFTGADFERIRKLVYEHAGIALSDNKRDLVYSRLARRLRTLGDRSFADYIARLDHDGEEWEVFVNSLTTNLTSFFREPHHFDTLREYLVQRTGSDPVRIWSAACSTGEEPYSIAMTLAEHFGSFETDARILATDLDTEVLATAERGIYAMERLSKLSDQRRHTFFLRGKGRKEGYARVRPELWRMLGFRQLNLLEDQWPLRGPFDAIFCRNVMIYFDRPTQRKVLEHFAPLLREDGLLFVGHSESLHHAADLFRTRGGTVYEKVH